MNKPKSRNENIVIQEMNKELLIYDLKDNKAFLLNETSAFILNKCNGKRDVSEISKALAKKNRQPVNEEIVWLALEQLKENNLLIEAELPVSFLKSNRREMIRRIGLATMVMLPFITAVTAPKAAAAASVCFNVIGVCQPPITNICANCPVGTRFSGRVFNSNNGTCSQVLTTFTATCLAGGINLDFIVDSIT